MEATMQHDLWVTGQLDASLEQLLSQYETSTGSVEGNVPSEIIQGATSIPSEHAKEFSAGPADCVAPDGEDLADSTRENVSNTINNQSAGIITVGNDDVKAIELWNEIMKKYEVAELCEKELERLTNVNDPGRKAYLQQRQAEAVAAAVEALGRLHNKEIEAKFCNFVKESRADPTLTISHSDVLLRSSHPLCWYSCFVRLFPRGVCAEK